MNKAIKQTIESIRHTINQIENNVAKQPMEDWEDILNGLNQVDCDLDGLYSEMCRFD